LEQSKEKDFGSLREKWDNGFSENEEVRETEQHCELKEANFKEVN